MKKIKGILDRFEENKAIIKYNGSKIILEKNLMREFSEGDSVILVVTNENEDIKNSNQVAKKLLTQVLRGE